MDTLFQIKKIKDVIATGDLLHAFNLIKDEFTPVLKTRIRNQLIFDRFEEDVTVLFAFYNRIENSKKKSVISNKEYQTELNIITRNLLSIIGGIKEEISNDKIFFNKNIESSINEYQGFHKEDVEKTLSKSIKLLEKARHFRVVGIGRQYVDQFRSLSSIKNYYEAIENRIKDVDQEDRFRYRRITIMELTDNFRSHLLNCFEYSERSGNNNRTELILLEDVEMQFTYFIIDEDLVVINLYTYTNDNVLDCPYAYWSTESETINLFINHFDRVWRRENHYGNILSSKKEFEEFVPFNNELLQHLIDIRSSIKRLPRESARTNWAISELKQTKDRLLGLTEYSLGIKNKITNGKLLILFSHYVRQLKQKDKYCTVSFFEFWEHITSEDTTEFYSANRSALINGADLTRVYIIDNNRITDDLYIQKQKPIIKAHFKLMKLFSNYKFKVLFMPPDNYSRYLLEYKNFAIWKSGDEAILFRPEYVNTMGGSVFPSMTYLHYINFDNEGHMNFNNNRELFENAEIDFDEILREQIQQNIDDDQKFFLQACGVE